MIQILKALNLLQTLLFIAALVWFFFAAADVSGDTVLIVIGLFFLWLVFIALVGKALYNAENKERREELLPHKLSVFEFMRKLQEVKKQ